MTGPVVRSIYKRGGFVSDKIKLYASINNGPKQIIDADVREDGLFLKLDVDKLKDTKGRCIIEFSEGAQNI